MPETTLEQGLRVLEARRAFATYVIYAYIGVSTLKIFQVFGVMAGQLNYEDVGNLDAPSIVGLVVGLLNWFLQFASKRSSVRPPHFRLRLKPCISFSSDSQAFAARSKSMQHRWHRHAD